MNKRLLVATTLLAFVTVFTLTLYPADSTDAAHCGALRTAANTAVADDGAALGKAWTACAEMLAQVGKPGYRKALYKPPLADTIPSALLNANEFSPTAPLFLPSVLIHKQC